MYSLRKSGKLFFALALQFKKQKHRLTPAVVETLNASFREWQQALHQKDRACADLLARAMQMHMREHIRKNFFLRARDLLLALSAALLLAVGIRQMVFELYEIPSGSMRPTFKEQDRLIVSKTTFGLNVPLTTRQFYFDPEACHRMGIAIFTVDGMDTRDPDMVYFHLFPGKKQYIKRLIGKPGDTLYFYGGKIYGIDAMGRDISHELQPTLLSQIEHIPFIRFEGTPQIDKGLASLLWINQTGEAVARLYTSSSHKVEGELLGPLRGQPYSDLWGMKHFAMCRLLTKDEVPRCSDAPSVEGEEGMLYLELKHHPNFDAIRWVRDEVGRLRPTLGLHSSLLPLQEAHLKELFRNLYTARFVVKQGRVSRYSAENGPPEIAWLPQMPGVPDGTYEFDRGTAYEVQWQGVLRELPSAHPLRQFDVERLQLLFNLGMEFDLRFSPKNRQQTALPSRYAYFRAGDLYLLGAPILRKEDAALKQFLQREHARAAPHVAFEDVGPPLKADGQLDIEHVKQFGLKVPSHMYYVLGDNHAMSADSRDFGFVPQGNLRGAPKFLFWPSGARWGIPLAPSSSKMSVTSLCVWPLLFGLWGLWIIRQRRRRAELCHF